MNIGKIIKVEVLVDEGGPDDDMSIIFGLLLTNEDGRQWCRQQLFRVYHSLRELPEKPAMFRIVCGEVVCPTKDPYRMFWTATPGQLGRFNQVGDMIQWPEFRVVLATTGIPWIVDFQPVLTAQEGKVAWIQHQIDEIDEKLRPFEIMTVKTKTDAKEEIALRDRLADLRRQLECITASVTLLPHKKESPQERVDRYLEWLVTDVVVNGRKGATGRLAKHEGKTRQYIERTLSSTPEGKTFMNR